MRICKFILIVGLLSLLFPGCKKHYSSSALIVCNESGEELWVESYIVSASCDSTKSFLLQEGRSKSVVLATSEKYETVNNAGSFLKRLQKASVMIRNISRPSYRRLSIPLRYIRIVCGLSSMRQNTQTLSRRKTFLRLTFCRTYHLWDYKALAWVNSSLSQIILS